jgi:GTPase SAR1 family protein
MLLRKWDLAGPERFRTVTSSYYRNSRGALLMYDISNRETFESIKMRWSRELQRNASPDTLIILVGNKSDISKSVNEGSVESSRRNDDLEREVSFEEGESLARELGLLFFMECSSKTGEHVEEIVMRLSAAILQQNPGNTLPIQPTIQATLDANRGAQNSCSLL